MRIANLDAQPTSESDPSPVTAATPFTANLAANSSVQILATPAAGFVWEIILITIRSTAAAAAFGSAIFRGHTTSTEFAGASAIAAGAINYIAAPKNFFLAEGADFVTGANVACVGDIVARQILQPSGQ